MSSRLYETMSSSPLSDLSEWEAFLDQNYHQLSRRIRVENLLSRLRQNVLSQEDQQTVLHLYCTQFLKAGNLIDIIRTKGQRGFLCFMEAVEYEYPDLYQETTGKHPRPSPDKDMGQGGCRSSLALMEKMKEFVGECMDVIVDKKRELTSFQEVVHQLKGELEQQYDEQQINSEQIKNLQAKLQEATTENEELRKNLEKELQARLEIEKRYEALRKSNLNEFYNLARQPVTRSLTLNPFTWGGEESVKDASVRPSDNSLPGKGMVKTLKDNYEKGATQLPQTLDTKLDLNERKELEKTLSQLQQSNDLLQGCLEQFKSESEQCRLKQTEAEAEMRLVSDANEKLKAETRKMEDQCRVMADMITKLKGEIDCRIKTPTDRNIKLPPLFPKMFDSQTGNSSSDETKMFNVLGESQKPLSKKGTHTKEGFTAANKLAESSMGAFFGSTTPSRMWQSAGN